MFTKFYDFYCIYYKRKESEMMFMIECIVNMLVKKFGLKRDVAFIFYMEVLNRYKLEHLISHIDNFKDFEELKKYYLGGN